MSAYERALQALGFRQKSYQAVFAAGSPGHLVLTDLAVFCRAFTPDSDGLTRDELMSMHGRRQAFFRITNHLKLSPIDLEAVYRTALIRSAERLQGSQGANE